ncbi:MAG: hypothetical protein JWM05_2092 [Acidimicrobiales bacterium]|nr:hypothetical protein [Acidimicrobiales bacterium]
MAAISEDVVRELASFKGRGGPVTTCYLDVDGRRHRAHLDYEKQLHRLLGWARSRANGTKSVHHDLTRIEDHVKAGIDRKGMRGLAMFSCSSADLWRVVPVPVPVHDQIVVADAPAVAQLEAATECSGRFAALLVDRQRARVMVFEVDELVAEVELFDELPRDYDVRGDMDRGDTSNHVENMVHKHLHRAGELAFAAWQEHQFDHLSLACPEELTSAIEQHLHPYLRDRLCDRLPVAATASLAEVREAVVEEEVQAERRRETALVERWREALGIGRRAVAGLAPTLEALFERRVDTMLVSEGYVEEGWRCSTSGRLCVKGPKSPVTGARMEHVPDVVEEAMQEALLQGCEVEICHNADLDVAGRIGALLRF